MRNVNTPKIAKVLGQDFYRRTLVEDEDGVIWVANQDPITKANRWEVK